MALAAMLSALRELVLDLDEIPKTVDQRLSLYKKLFPKLSAEEREDLAKIPEDKLKIYTSTIFTGEAKVFKNHFPISMSLIKKHWKELGGQKFSPYRFTRRLHKSRPWKDTATLTLAENFVLHVNEDLTPLQQYAPFLPDLVRLEHRTLLLRRAQDLAPTLQLLDTATLERFSVSELMNQEFQLPPYLELQVFDFNVMQVSNDFYRHNQQVPVSLATEKVFCLGARNHQQSPRWEGVEENFFKFFEKRKSAHQTFSGEDLAEAFLAGVDSDVTDEAAALTAFIQETKRLTQAGIFVIAQG